MRTMNTGWDESAREREHRKGRRRPAKGRKSAKAKSETSTNKSNPYHHAREKCWEYSDYLIKLDVRLAKSDCADEIVSDFMKFVGRHSLRGLTASESEFYAKCGLEIAGRLADCSERQLEQSERLVNYVNETLTSPASDSVPETIALVMADGRDRSPTAEPTTTNKAKSGVCLDWSGKCQPDAASSATGEITPS